METEERIGIEEIERYKPIKKGWFILISSLLSICISLTLVGGVVLTIVERGEWFSEPTYFWLILFGLLIATGMVIVLTLSYWQNSFEQDFTNWLQEYWDKNVRGWSLYCYTEQISCRRGPYAVHEEPIHSFIGRRNLWPYDFPFQDSFAPALEIPLGGWFATAKYHQGNGWKIKLSHLDTHNICLSIKGPHGGWSGGMYTPEKILLHHENFIYELSLGKHAGNLLYRYDRVVDDHIEECKKRHRLELLFRELTEMRQGAVDDFEKTIEAISNTSRLGKSKEAQRIREEILVPALLKILPEEDLRRRKYETKVA